MKHLEDVLYIQIDEFFSLGVSDSFKDKEGSCVNNIIYVNSNDAYDWLFKHNHYTTAFNLAMNRVEGKIDRIVEKHRKNLSMIDC